ncbi:zinc finger protein SNAI3 [Ctenodactylus gundi]
MPRSFLVKTHPGHRVPSYGQLETRRGGHGACSACRGLAAPPCPPDKSAASTPSDPTCPWDCTSATACVPLPLLQCHQEALGTTGPEPPEIGWVAPQAARAPIPPLRDSLNHLNLPPLLTLPTRWPPILCSDGHGAPNKLLKSEGPAGAPAAFQCVHCHKPYHTIAGLARHQQMHCPLRAGRVFTCKHCTKEYASLGALKMHIRTHTLPCVCMACGKAFSRPWLLQGHIRTHTGEKPYACPHCSRAFADRSNLRAHLQTHSGTKRYPCKGCAKTFSRMSLLARHQEAGCCPGP